MPDGKFLPPTDKAAVRRRVMERVLALLSCLVVARAGFGADAGPAAPGGPLTLAVRPKVQKELGLSEDQVREVKRLYADAVKDPRAAGKAFKELGKALSPGQLKRLRQISYQVRGGAAVGDAEVQRELKLTARQKEEVGKVWKEEEAGLDAFLSRARFRSPEARDAYVLKHRREAGERMLKALTEAQRKRFKDMQGKPVDVRSLGG
jgi:hypothetical protein